MAKAEPTEYDKAKAAFNALNPLEREMFDQASQALARLDRESRSLSHAIDRVLAGADGKTEEDGPTVVVLSKLRDARNEERAKRKADFFLKFPFAKDFGWYW